MAPSAEHTDFSPAGGLSGCQARLRLDTRIPWGPRPVTRALLPVLELRHPTGVHAGSGDRAGCRVAGAEWPEMRPGLGELEEGGWAGEPRQEGPWSLPEGFPGSFMA